MQCDTKIMLVCEAVGLMYLWYTSKVSKEDTAMSSALAQLVTAMKSTMSKATAPPFPKSACAAYAEANPAEISDEVGSFG